MGIDRTTPRLKRGARVKRRHLDLHCLTLELAPADPGGTAERKPLRGRPKRKPTVPPLAAHEVNCEAWRWLRGVCRCGHPRAGHGWV